MNEKLIEELRRGDLDKIKDVIKDSGVGADASLLSVINDPKIINKIVEVVCEYVGQVARSEVVGGGWEGFMIGAPLMRGIVDLHDLADRPTLIHFTHTLLLVAAAIMKGER